MVGSEIYSDFTNNIRWIQETVGEDVRNLPPRLRLMGKRIASERLFIVPDGINTPRLDPEFGRPIPYSVYWFADALGYADNETINSFALAMTYSAMSSTLRDDIVDSEELKGERTQLLELSNIFQRKYIEIFKDEFGRHSSLWCHLAQALDEQLRYESWNKAFTLETCRNPFSAHFIEDSSRYFYSTVFPSLVAVAMAANAESKIPKISRFARHLSCGSRVHDDLKDCRSDLGLEDMNHSCVLMHARQCIGGGKELGEETLANLFLDEGFVRGVYGPILLYFNKAREDILPFNSRYLTQFMDEQLSFCTRARDTTLKRRSNFFGSLESLLKPTPKNNDVSGE
jgi:hypothetical protein